MREFPSYWDAPSHLLELDGSCGLVAAWGILRYFKKRTSAADLIRACGYTKKHGTFMIALATALRGHGLVVRFHSEPDPEMESIERRFLVSARKSGVDICGPTDLPHLLGSCGPNSLPVVLFNTDEGNGHISPLLGVKGEDLILPFSDDETMSKDDFTRRWSEPGILRQALVVARP